MGELEEEEFGGLEEGEALMKVNARRNWNWKSVIDWYEEKVALGEVDSRRDWNWRSAMKLN